MTPDPLTAFIEARLAEREALGLQMQAALDNGWNYFDEPGDFDAGWMLRDVAAKRAILADCKLLALVGIAYPGEAGPETAREIMRHLAAIDAGHPDYDPAWTPGPS